ncbi:hypothetical protein ACOMHN_059499 [Nucella lapillus]
MRMRKWLESRRKRTGMLYGFQNWYVVRYPELVCCTVSRTGVAGRSRSHLLTWVIVKIPTLYPPGAIAETRTRAAFDQSDQKPKAMLIQLPRPAERKEQ